MCKCRKARNRKNPNVFEKKQGRTRALKGNDIIYLVDLFLSAYEHNGFVARWEQD
jgi:hypothetical protein